MSFPTKDEYPREKAKRACIELIRDAVREVYSLELSPEKITIRDTPSHEYGDIASSIALRLAREVGKKPEIVAQELVTAIKRKNNYFAKIEAQKGYINFWLPRKQYYTEVLFSVNRMNKMYGTWNEGMNRKVIVEHTSANPIHPIHVGTARNAILGDFLARFLKWRGYNVETHYYVNDKGRQVSILVNAYMAVKNKLTPKVKMDHWLGSLYACANAVIENNALAKELQGIKKKFENMMDSLVRLQKELRKRSIEEDNETFREYYVLLSLLLEQTKYLNWFSLARKLKELLKEISTTGVTVATEILSSELWSLLESVESKMEEWHEIRGELLQKYPEIYSLLERAFRDIDINNAISDVMGRYEKRENNMVKIFREMEEGCLKGFGDTLKKLGISHDVYDWESEIVWSGYMDRVINEFRRKGLLKQYTDSKALYVDIPSLVLSDEKLQKIYGISRKVIDKLKKKDPKTLEKYLPPVLVLRRSDGTVPYIAVDIAYSFYKFEKFSPERVYNVIASEQSLPQKHVKAALHLLGHDEWSDNLIHYSYELVQLPEMKMSGRRGRYISLDELITETTKETYMKMSEIKISKINDPAARMEIARKVAIGAIRYALLRIEPSKVIQFRWDSVLDFSRNSGPALQYAYARANSILEKAKDSGYKPVISAETLKTKAEITLLEDISRFPEVVDDVSHTLKPNILAEYANRIARDFNYFYEKCPILSAKEKKITEERLALVKAFVITLRNILEILGIPVLEKM